MQGSAGDNGARARAWLRAAGGRCQQLRTVGAEHVWLWPCSGARMHHLAASCTHLAPNTEVSHGAEVGCGPVRCPEESAGTTRRAGHQSVQDLVCRMASAPPSCKAVQDRCKIGARWCGGAAGKRSRYGRIRWSEMYQGSSATSGTPLSSSAPPSDSTAADGADIRAQPSQEAKIDWLLNPDETSTL